MRYRVFNKEKEEFETEEQLEKWFFMKPNGRLVVGASSCGEEMLDWMDREYIDKTYVVSYSTGISDKNGKEIFESDILTNGQNKYIVYYGEYESEYENGGVGFYVKIIDDHECTYNFEKETGNCNHVIGNIYENPELLEKIK